MVQETQTALQEIKEEQNAQSDMLSRVNAQSANENIKWDINFRTAYHRLDYNKVDGSSATNPSLFTNRLWLGMGSKVNSDLFFYGQLAVYNYWGADTVATSDKVWQANSRPNEVDLGLRQAYFVYKFGNDWDVPMSFSAGRRAATDGFLANHREGTAKPGSPLAHITNMEVDGAMVQLDLDQVFLPGSYLKVVYGRAHDPIGRTMPTPYIDTNAKDD